MVRSVGEAGVCEAGDLLVIKPGSPKHSSYSEEDNIADVGARMMYLLHFTGVKLIGIVYWIVMNNKSSELTRLD